MRLRTRPRTPRWSSMPCSSAGRFRPATMEDLAGLAVPGGGPRPGFRRQISRPCRRTTRRPAVAQPAFSMDSAWRMTASTMGAHSCPCVLQHHGRSRFSSASRSKRERSAVSTRELVKARTADGGGTVWCSHDGSPFKRTGGGPELISEAQLQQPRAKVGCRAPEQVESVGLDTGSRYCLRARHRRRHPSPASYTHVNYRFRDHLEAIQRSPEGRSPAGSHSCTAHTAAGRSAALSCPEPQEPPTSCKFRTLPSCWPDRRHGP
jgi:hypothetical protein